MTEQRIGVLTSGGDAPGMNAALRAIIRTSIYHNCKIFGIKQGYQGMINGYIEELDLSSVSNIIKSGGTFIQTARCQEFFSKEGRKKAYETLTCYSISQLIVIGGDGSFRGLHEFLTEYPIHGIGVPGTIDNDVYGTDFTIGFDSAVNTALEAIDKIRDTAASHSRIFIIEVMGRNSGYIGLYTGIGGGAEDIIIPETVTDISVLCDQIERGRRRGKKSSIIVVAEGGALGDALRIQQEIERFAEWDVKVSILGHIQRGGSPTAFDRVLASRLGYEAVLAILRGESDKMVGIVNNTVVLTPLQDTWTKKKTFDLEYVKMAKVLAI